MRATLVSMETVRPGDDVLRWVANAAGAKVVATAARQLYELLGDLQPHEWDARAHDEIGTVRDLVVHLVGSSASCSVG